MRLPYPQCLRSEAFWLEGWPSRWRRVSAVSNVACQRSLTLLPRIFPKAHAIWLPSGFEPLRRMRAILGQTGISELSCTLTSNWLGRQYCTSVRRRYRVANFAGRICGALRSKRPGGMERQPPHSGVPLQSGRMLRQRSGSANRWSRTAIRRTVKSLCAPQCSLMAVRPRSMRWVGP